jgi:FAD-dependent oxidoreductase domain-containing protein 1
MADTDDVVIVGGGIAGAATAMFLARDHHRRVTVVERDPTYRIASSSLSASSIRQQFSTPVNIDLSRASLELMRSWMSELGFVEAGYLYLATSAGAASMRAAHAVQRACGADIELFDVDALCSRWPWLNVDGLALGAWGASGEGWFDGPALHARCMREAKAAGARFVHADVRGFDTSGDTVRAAVDARGVRHAGRRFVIAAGAWSAPLGVALGVDLPIRAHKRDVFVIDSPAVLPRCPLVIDPSGVWLRPEGHGFLTGAPPRDGDPDSDHGDGPLDAIDHGLLDDVIWPALAARIPAFEALRVRSAWAGYYEMNTFDHNALAGALPGWRNAACACGFSGHGMQHALAVGQSLASWLVKGAWGKVDLSPLSLQRIARDEPLVEANII